MPLALGQHELPAPCLHGHSLLNDVVGIALVVRYIEVDVAVEHRHRLVRLNDTARQTALVRLGRHLIDLSTVEGEGVSAFLAVQRRSRKHHCHLRVVLGGDHRKLRISLALCAVGLYDIVGAER